MSVLTFRSFRGYLLRGSALAVALGFAGVAIAQTQLPEVVVSAPKEKPKAPPTQAKHAAPTHAPASTHATAPVVQTAPISPAAQLNAKADAFDAARSNLFTTIGTASTTLTQSTI